MPKPNSKRAKARRQPKIRCAWKQCSAKKDLKNQNSHVLNLDSVDLSCTRTLRKNCQTARFCCAEHKTKCLLSSTARHPPRGGREALTAAQVVALFNTLLLEVNAPWAAVAFLLSIFMGEREGCVLCARDSWFVDLHTEHARARIPRVNKKTTPRENPLDAGFAKLLMSWMSPDTGPLRGRSGSQWPHPEQKLSVDGKQRSTRLGQLLFPGRRLGGHNKRRLDKAVTPRGFHGKFQAAQRFLVADRGQAHARGETHLFDEVDVERITSHSGKKSAVTLLKESQVPTTVVSMLTGTSCRMLESTYFKPSKKMQRTAATQAFTGITSKLSEPVDCQEHGPAPQEQRFCIKCGLARERDWRFCAGCGTKAL